MSAKSEKCYRPADVAKFRLRLYELRSAFRFGFCARDGRHDDIHFQQIVHLPSAVTTASAVDRALMRLCGDHFLAYEWTRELRRCRAGSS
jgi:hypothetical protein